MDARGAGGAGDARLPGGLVDRPHLRAILDDGAALTIISGPAGAGKSTLIAQWVRTVDTSRAAIVPAAFGSQSSNPHTLWHDVLSQLSAAEAVRDAAALRDAVRGFDSLRDVTAAVRRTFADLALPCVLVIDNAERTDLAALLADLVALLAESPDLRVVVSTRRSLAPRVLQLAAATETVLIGAPSLMLSPDEARELIERATGSPAPPGSVDAGRTLALSARLTAMTILAGQWPLGASASGRATIADALMARLVSEDVAPEFLDFLVRTSLPGVVTPELVALLGCEARAEEHLDRAEALGLGMRQASEGVVGFVYTPVLREALHRHLAARPAAEVEALHRVVARWAFGSRRHLEALTHALAANDHHLASRFVRKSWFVLSQTCPDDVVELLGREGSATLARHPVLSTAMALMLVTVGHRLRAFGYFQSAVLRSSARRGRDDDPAERLWESSVRSLAARLSGHFERAATAAEEVRAVYAHLSPAEHAGIEDTAALLLSSAGLSLFYAGRVEDAVDVLETGMQVQVPDDDAGWYHCAATLAGIHALEGRVTQARRIRAAIDEANPPTSWRTDFFGVLEQIAAAVLALADLDGEQAQAHLDAVSFHLGTSEHWPFHVAVQSEVHLLAGRAGAALRGIESARARGAYAATSRTASDRLHAAHALVLLSSGDLAGADRVSARISRGHEAIRVLAGLRARATDDPERAFAVLSGIAAGAEDLRDRHLARIALLVAASAALRVGAAEPARRTLARAVAEMDEERTPLALRWLPEGDVAALADAADPATAAVLRRLVEGMPRVLPLLRIVSPPVTVTTRERTVLNELARTSSTAQIAARLRVSPNTVKAQRRTAYRKLGARNRAEALLRAAELGLLTGEASSTEEGAP